MNRERKMSICQLKIFETQNSILHEKALKYQKLGKVAVFKFILNFHSQLC